MHNDIPDVENSLDSYISNLIHIINNIFHHNTLERRIRIHLSKLVQFDTKDTNEVVIESNPNMTLNRVCERLKDSDRYMPYSSQEGYGNSSMKDISIFLTRRKFGPAGYAPVGKICTEDSCSIQKEEGFASVFVIAHEIGHVLGLTHDGESNGK